MLQQDCLSDLEENVGFENFHAGQLQAAAMAVGSATIRIDREMLCLPYAGF